jgi:two-component system, OmpR family, sensor kinase
MARGAGASHTPAAPRIHHASPGRGAFPLGKAGAVFRRVVRPWQSLARGSLSARLIASLVLLVILACAAVGLATYAVLSKSLLANLNQELEAATARQYAACMEHQGSPSQSAQNPGGPQASDGPDGLQSSRSSHRSRSMETAHSSRSRPGEPDTDNAPPNCGDITGQAAGTFGARLKHGVFTQQAIVNGKCDLSAADKATLAALPPAPQPKGGSSAGPPPNVPTYTRDLDSIGGDYRLTAMYGDDGDILYTGIPLNSMETMLSEVEIAEAVVFTVVVLLVAGIGTGLVRLSLRPLRRVATTATMVTELPLDTGEVSLPAQVPDDNPRTEVGQVGAAFNRMLRHVESALARRAASEARLRRFAADASHELRTPLSAIRGYAELALRHRGPVPEDVTHALQRVESESARMSVLVDELLLLARLDAGRPLAREPVDLTRLAIDAASDARAASPSHRWLLELPGEPIMVRGDEYRLRQVLANLLGNAAKHTPAGCTVTVAVAALNHAPPPITAPASAATAPAAPVAPAIGGGAVPAPAIQLSVTDDGPGIPPDLLPDLFERFVRGDSSRSHTAGSTGLGLAIVDAVITAHEGTVQVTSRPGRTAFTITLPRLQESPGPGDFPWPEPDWSGQTPPA